MQIDLGINQNQQLLEAELVDSTTILANGSSNVLQVVPPEGYIGKVNTIAMYSSAVPGAGSGIHALAIYVGGNINSRVLQVASAYNSAVQTLGLVVITGTPIPLSDAAVSTNLKDLTFNHTYPLIIEYTNLTNASQTLPRSALVQYTLEAETSF